MLKKTVWTIGLLIIGFGIHGVAFDLSVVKTVKLQIPDDFDAGWAIAAGDYFLLNDVKNAKVLIFDNNGKFLFSQGQKGLGPGEMLTPTMMAYKGGSLLVADLMRQGVHRFRVTNGRLREPDFVKLGFHPRNIAFDGDGIVVVGIFRTKTGLSWAQRISIADENHELKPLIRWDTLLGISFEKIRKSLMRLKAIGGNELCSVGGRVLFGCWGGNLRILAHHLDSGKHTVFGNPGRYYKPPRDTGKLERLYQSHDLSEKRKISREREKICMVRSIAATRNDLLLIYRTPLINPKGKAAFVLQRYTHDGVFRGEKVLTELFRHSGLDSKHIEVQSFEDQRDGAFLIVEYLEGDDGSRGCFVHNVRLL